MNRIGVMVESFKLPILDGLSKAKEIGAGGVQLYVGGKDAIDKLWTPAYREDVLGKAESLGLRVSALCGDLPGHGLADPSEIEWKIPEIGRRMQLCRDLKTNVMTSHIGVIPPDKSKPRYAIMRDACKRIAETAEKLGVTLAIETGAEIPEVLREFLSDVGSERIGVNYDPANIKMVCNVDPVAGVAVLGKSIVHTHAKDGKCLKYVGPNVVYGFFEEGGIEDVRMEECFLETALGDGDVDFPAWIRELNKIGYTGFLTIEREVGDNPEADIRKAVGFLEKLLAS